MNVHVDFQQFDSGTGQPFVSYPKLDFQPHSLFALGSPIGKLFAYNKEFTSNSASYCEAICKRRKSKVDVNIIPFLVPLKS